MKYLSEEDEQHVAEDFQGPPGASLRFAEARGSAPSEDENYCKAVDNLHEAARDFTTKWLKAPQDSSFNEWFEACETLERAAVEYAKANDKLTHGATP